MPSIITRFIVASVSIIAALSIVTVLLQFYADYRASEAERAVIGALNHIAAGEVPNSVDTSRIYELGELIYSLQQGFEQVQLDNIGVGFNAYELIFVSVDGARISTDALYINGTWQIGCCGYRKPAGH